MENDKPQLNPVGRYVGFRSKSYIKNPFMFVKLLDPKAPDPVIQVLPPFGLETNRSSALPTTMGPGCIPVTNAVATRFPCQVGSVQTWGFKDPQRRKGFGLKGSRALGFGFRV